MGEKSVDIPRSSSTVMVACKLPNGLVLQLYDQKDGYEMTPQGPRPIKIAVKKGEPITLRGVALAFGQIPEYDMRNGYAITPVPADFWKKWCEQNEDSDALNNRMIFAASDITEINAKTKEARSAKVKSNMEPIDPKNPPSVGGGMKVTPATNTN